MCVQRLGIRAQGVDFQIAALLIESYALHVTYPRSGPLDFLLISYRNSEQIS